MDNIKDIDSDQAIRLYADPYTIMLSDTTFVNNGQYYNVVDEDKWLQHLYTLRTDPKDLLYDPDVAGVYKLTTSD